MNFSAPAIKISIQRMVCTGCGAEANASYNCGKAYMPKAVRAAEAVAANPEKSDRAIAAELGDISHVTVGKARKEATGNQLPVDERIGLDGKTRKRPAKRAKPEVDEDGNYVLGEVAPYEGGVTVDEYFELAGRANKRQRRVSELTEALNAKEAEAARNWPADIGEKQIKKRDKYLTNIAWWQRELETLYGEVTGRPPWRLELIAKNGARHGNGARLATRREAEAYGQAVIPEAEGGNFEILPCEHETANMQFVGTDIRFSHGDCVLLNWHPLGADAQ
jgi:hypothetical protein